MPSPVESPEGVIDLEEYAKDRLEKWIEAKFKGHLLAKLVEAILITQGFEIS